MFAEFSQPKGSKEVSRLEFGKDAQYLASFGRDDKNSFYVYDLRTKELLYSDETGENDYLLDLAFNPLKDEVCLVGVNKIIFGYITNKSKKNVYDSNALKIFTTVTYTSDGNCLIGTESGEILVFGKNNTQKKLLKIAYGSIQTITHKEMFKKIYVADSLNMVYILKDHGEYDVIDEFQTESPVKALDVNEDEDLVLGLKNGSIKIKKLKDETKSESIFLRSHSFGTIGGLDFIPECRAITTGEDNRILLWNLRSKKCESVGVINPLFINESADNENEKYIYKKSNQSGVVSYNNSKEHIAIGINNGYVSIRNGMKDLNKRICKDIQIGKDIIAELKYTNYGELLIATSLDGEIKIMETSEYKVEKHMQLDGASIINLDWDLTNSYIQCVTNKAQYIFINVSNENIKLIDDPTTINNVEWPQITCKFGYNVQGVYLGSTDPDYISSVSKAHSKKLILSGNDDYLLNLTNYPAIQESAKFKSYRGHSGRIKRIIWSPDDESILTIAEEDQSVLLWKLEQV
jgi:WD40 repeat protein